MDCWVLIYFYVFVIVVC